MKKEIFSKVYPVLMCLVSLTSAWLMLISEASSIFEVIPFFKHWLQAEPIYLKFYNSFIFETIQAYDRSNLFFLFDHLNNNINKTSDVVWYLNYLLINGKVL